MRFIVPILALIGGFGTILACFAMNKYYKRANGGLVYAYISQLSEYEPEWYVFVSGIAFTVLCILVSMGFNVPMIHKEIQLALEHSNAFSVKTGRVEMYMLTDLRLTQTRLLRWSIVNYTSCVCLTFPLLALGVFRVDQFHWVHAISAALFFFFSGLFAVSEWAVFYTLNSLQASTFVGDDMHPAHGRYIGPAARRKRNLAVLYMIAATVYLVFQFIVCSGTIGVDGRPDYSACRDAFHVSSAFEYLTAIAGLVVIADLARDFNRVEYHRSLISWDYQVDVPHAEPYAIVPESYESDAL